MNHPPYRGQILEIQTRLLQPAAVAPMNVLRARAEEAQIQLERRKMACKINAAAAQLQSAGKEKDARTTLRTFHQQLADVRVLDPACGSGNFLYVTFEHLKRLEGEVVELRETLGDTIIYG